MLAFPGLHATAGNKIWHTEERGREDIYSKSSLLWPLATAIWRSPKVTSTWLASNDRGLVVSVVIETNTRCSGWAKTKRLFAIVQVNVAVVITAALAGAASQVHHLAPPTVSNGLGVCVASLSDATPELRCSWRSRSLLALASVFLLPGVRRQVPGTRSHWLLPCRAPTPVASPGRCGGE